MADKLVIYNDAILECGGELLATLTDDAKSRRLCDQVYPRLIGEMLETGSWKFAMRSISINADADLTVQFGYNNAFTLPDDWRRTYVVTNSPTLDPVGSIDFMVDGRTLYANDSTLYCRFVSDDEAFGGDLGQWPFLFTRAFVLRLAQRISGGLTDSEGRRERINRDADRACLKAMAVDAFSEGPKRPPTGRFIAARFGARLGQGYPGETPSG